MTGAAQPSDAGFGRLVCGTWAWGDKAYWGYGERFGPSDVVDAFVASVEGGATYFDTAETYGHGESEKILGFLLEKHGGPARVATKFALLPGRGGARGLVPALRASLRRLRRAQVDLYQVHWPDRQEASLEALAEALAEAVHQGLTRHVGVSNFSAEELRRTDDALRARGARLASNQVHMSLLHRAPEVDGVLDACRERGATLLAYSPLEQGLLAGRYLEGAPPTERRAKAPWFQPAFLARARPLVAEVGAVASEIGATAAQVALAYLAAQPGVVPVAGATSGRAATQNAASVGLVLPAQAMARLELASRDFRTARTGP